MQTLLLQTNSPESRPSSEPAAIKPDSIAMAQQQSEVYESQAVALVRYLSRTAVHTYAFSVAANAILSLFPFIVLMLTIARLLHSAEMVAVIRGMLHVLLPTGQEFVTRNMVFLVYSQKRVAAVSVVALLISSTGIFLPLEVALNQVWAVTENRSYWRNQLISFSLAFMVGVLALLSIAISASHEMLLKMIFFGHTGSPAFHFLEGSLLKMLGAVVSIAIFFAIYWILPNRRIRATAVLPAAVVTGLLWEGAKVVYVAVLPWLDLKSVYGPFSISVGLMLWAFISGLILLAGAHFSATRFFRKQSASADDLPAETVAPPRDLTLA
ncbi:MAG: YihY/virulence factor BrkB family protein [Acidobacteriaceae bacterium]